MKLKVQQGKEHKPVLSEDIMNPDEFMYPAFQQAIKALRTIVVQAKDFNNGKNDSLFGYSHNIIAFSGQRGQGKTSTMLSFSRALEQKSTLQKISISDCEFEVLPPMDPTILEEKQSILGVVLSRMYQKAESVWQDTSRSSTMRICSNTEADKNELLMMFQKCLSGINAIKFRKGEEIRSLSEIHEISDRAVLKENICKLIRKLLRFCGKHSENSFLVIQLDDTDFQLRKSYEVLEDIRKFLSIPNIVILMATDMDLLRILITQHYLERFEKSIDQELIDSEYLQKLEAKYLDKLMPPTHVVYLPQLDETILRHGESIDLVYNGIRNGEEVNLLRSQNKTEAERYSFQSQILRYVYRKTRLVFAEPTAYMHNLIPTTFRGLVQFLSILSSMEDVPFIQQEDKKEPKTLREALKIRVGILETNLQLFEDYFINDWVAAKLPKKKDDIKKLREAVSKDKYNVAISILNTQYAKLNEQSTRTEEPCCGRANYDTMIEFIERLSTRHRSTEDFYLFFTIHTYFSIENNKSILQQIKKEASKRTDELVIFDFSPDTTNLPNRYQEALTKAEEISSKAQDISKVLQDIARLPTEVLDYIVKSSDKEINRNSNDKKPTNKQATDDKNGKEETDKEKENRIRNNAKEAVGLMSFVMGALVLGNADLRKHVNKETSQESVYDLQIAAAIIAANWDVQHKLENISKNIAVGKDITLTVKGVEPAQRITLTFWSEAIDKVLSEINGDVSSANSMITVRLSAIGNVRFSTLNEVSPPSSRNMSDGDAEGRLEQKHKLMEELQEKYRAFRRVLNSLPDKNQAEDVFGANFKDWMKSDESDMRKFAEFLLSKLSQESVDKNKLSHSLGTRFSNLCAKKGIDYNKIKG